jgi:hypothetical protein
MDELDKAQLRTALGWETDDYDKAKEATTNPLVWLWQVLQGDFHEEATTAQALTAAAIGALPLVGQICLLRDLVADCKKLIREPDNPWFWTVLAMTLLGLFPSLGALLKGVLGIFFGVLRRIGSKTMGRAIDVAMGWVISYLRRREVQTYIKALRIDDIFGWLSAQVKSIKGKVTLAALTAAFDSALAMLNSLADKVSHIPVVGPRAKAVVVQVRTIRNAADAGLAKALAPLQDILDRIVLRLEHESIASRRGILNANNVHFQGALPDDAAVTLMREADPLPGWLSTDGEKIFSQSLPTKHSPIIAKKVKEGWPALNDKLIKSFHELTADEIRGPARLYRVIAPTSRAMSDCWVSENVFKQLQSAADPRAAWRRHLAVWPHWNVNGEFVIYDIKRGESLKVWIGKTASQFDEGLPGYHLQGGWEQIVFNIERANPMNDTTAFYKTDGGPARQIYGRIERTDYDKLTDSEKKTYTEIREKINHISISGPFETGWGYTDFDGNGFGSKIGLPDLPGQITTLRN